MSETDGLAARINDARVFCLLTLRYSPTSADVLGAQRVAMCVLDALGVEWDRADYLARLEQTGNGEPDGAA